MHTYKSSKKANRQMHGKPYFPVLTCILRQKLAKLGTASQLLSFRVVARASDVEQGELAARAISVWATNATRNG